MIQSRHLQFSRKASFKQALKGSIRGSGGCSIYTTTRCSSRDPESDPDSEGARGGDAGKSHVAHQPYATQLILRPAVLHKPFRSRFEQAQRIYECCRSPCCALRVASWFVASAVVTSGPMITNTVICFNFTPIMHIAPRHSDDLAVIWLPKRKLIPHRPD